MTIFGQSTRVLLKPILEFIDDASVSEILINKFDKIYIERKGKLYLTEACFETNEHYLAAIRNIAQFVGRTIDEKKPILDARLPDGSRIHVVMPPCATGGTYMSIRKFARENLSIKNLIELKSINLVSAKFLKLCVALNKNIVISGGTSSGKTTFLNVLSSLISNDERIIVMEDSSELKLQQEHVVNMETKQSDKDGAGRITLRDLVKASLRMRPDRIVIGEVRGEEALDLLQALNTGHSGSLTTIHANDPKQTLTRLETLALMSEVNIPLVAIRNQVAGAIDIIVQTARLKDGTRKVTHISEVCDLDENGNYIVKDIFLYKIQKVNQDGAIIGDHHPTEYIPTFFDDAIRQGYKLDKTIFLENKTETK
jgi:pilus assembly protein CpaF